MSEAIMTDNPPGLSKLLGKLAFVGAEKMGQMFTLRFRGKNAEVWISVDVMVDEAFVGPAMRELAQQQLGDR